MMLGSWVTPAHPTYWDVPRNYTSGVLRHVQEGLAEFAPLDSRPALELALVEVAPTQPAMVPPAPPRKRQHGHPVRKPARKAD
jgi:hypothetical protein